jgi:RNA polymerase sigma-70 factor, ECF subfamily
MDQGGQCTQTFRTPTVLELESFSMDDKTIEVGILSSPLRKAGPGPLRESPGTIQDPVFMTAMISGPRYGSTIELRREADAPDFAHEGNTRGQSGYSTNRTGKCSRIRSTAIRGSRQRVFAREYLLKRGVIHTEPRQREMGRCAQIMAGVSTLLAVRSETPLPGVRSGPDPGDQEPSANMAARQNPTIRTRTKDRYFFARGDVRFYGQYDHRSSISSIPASLGVCYAVMTLPGEKRHFLSQVLDEVFDGLYGYAMVLSRDRTEAEDLVQETCMRAVKAIESLQPCGNAKSWLFTILRNIWLNQVRQRRAAPKIVQLDVDESTLGMAVESSKDPHALYVSKVERDRVREAIQQLPDEFREIIVLREYEELSYKEIATLLDCPAGTVMSRLGRARSKLRSLLSSTLGPTDRRAKGVLE